jgi:hypothetical protein
VKVLEGPEKGRQRIAIYGDPKSRKTNIATSFPCTKGIYVADDPGSERMESTLARHKGKWTIVVPDSTDPYKEAVEIASHKWEGYDTIVWDTFTIRTQRILASFADTGVFSENKHIGVGTKGSLGYIAQPMMGDYAVTQRAMVSILDFLFRQPLNVVCNFWADLADKDVSPVFGPMTVGQSAIRSIAGRFDNLFRIEAKPPSTLPNQSGAKVTEYFVHMQTEGRWLAGARAPKALPKFKVGDDPGEFWEWFGKETA